MKHNAEDAQLIDTDRIHLDLENPRHESYESQEEVISYLCSNDSVARLARDIVDHGLSPLDNFAVVAQKEGRKKAYVVVEGNRRLCALKLLGDPDLAPPAHRETFRKLAENWTPIRRVAAVEFGSKNEARLWIERAHSGILGGIGRKPWNAEQKTRFSGDRKNLVAQIVLDYAEKNKMITPEERKGKITTASRFFSNPLFRESLGIDTNHPDGVARTRPKPDFDVALKKFTADLVGGKKVHSRMNQPHIQRYSRELSAADGVSTSRVEPQLLNSGATDVPTNGGKAKKPKRPKHAKKLTYDESLFEALENIPSYKLPSLYYSLCEIDVEKHTPLIAVGLWSFLETLTACCGRRDNVDFHSFLSKQKLTELKVCTANQSKAVRQVVSRISDLGNTTKHHTSSAAFNDKQMVNDVDTLLKLFNALAIEAKNNA